MNSTGIVYLACVGLGFGWLIWRLATMKTDPEGYVRIATYTDKGEVKQARRILGDARIAFLIDDHSFHFYGTRVRILVLSDRAAEAANLLKEAVFRESEDDADE